MISLFRIRYIVRRMMRFLKLLFDTPLPRQSVRELKRRSLTTRREDVESCLAHISVWRSAVAVGLGWIEDG